MENRILINKTACQRFVILAASLVFAFSTLSTPLATAASQLYFVHNDHLGTPQAITDQGQQIVWRGRYKPFGEVEETFNAQKNAIRYPGQWLDEESGYHYNYFRDYDPTTGRYIQSDPIGLDGGVNTYAYVGGNPANYTDPYGLFQM